MKLNGKQIKGPNTETIVIPRGDDFIVFEAQAVLDYAQFEAMVPETKPPLVLRRGDTVGTPNFEDPGYKEAVRKRGLLKYSWMIIQSLTATKDLEWELISLSDPSTWDKLENELRNSGFTPLEINRIIEGVLSANGLNEDKLDQARKRFLATRALQASL